jgi:pimeloyl-ACP methyl ester carboxylesterase
MELCSTTLFAMSVVAVRVQDPQQARANSSGIRASVGGMTEGVTDVGTDIVLLAGLWLPGNVWDRVAAELAGLGHRPLVPPLPGVDDSSTAADLDDQLDAVLTAVDATENPVLVGHSAASTLAWLAADRRPDQIRRVVMVGGFPESDGSTYADLFPMVDGAMPFPGWEPFAGPDAADLDEAARNDLAKAAIPVPESVAHGVVRLADEGRFAVPVTLVCPEFDPDDARGWVAAGEVPELAAVLDLSYVNIDSGHWPMITRPIALARLLDVIMREG